jgi:hypothetical protein
MPPAGRPLCLRARSDGTWPETASGDGAQCPKIHMIWLKCSILGGLGLWRSMAREKGGSFRTFVKGQFDLRAGGQQSSPLLDGRSPRAVTGSTGAAYVSASAVFVSARICR